VTERSWRGALGSGRARAGLALLALVVAVAVVGPVFAPHGETDYVGPPNRTGVSGALFGTDQLGQDVWSRFLLGGRSILLYAAIATALGLLIGAAVGLAAALAPPLADELMMRTVDVLLALPQFLLVLVALTTVGPEPWLIVSAVALTTAPRVARVVRGAAVTIARSDFVQVSEAIGESRAYVLRADLLPNVSGPILVEAGIRFTYALGIVASLAFLGFTPDANSADWGVMVQENRGAFAVQPWGVLLPVAAIALAALGAGLVADGVARFSARIEPR
jgi:peptide/nickel transport system permease protein